MAYNEEHHITPRGIVKEVRDLIDGVYSGKSERATLGAHAASIAVEVVEMGEKELAQHIRRLEKEMQEHARNLEFEQAAAKRDALAVLRERVLGAAKKEIR